LRAPTAPADPSCSRATVSPPPARRQFRDLQPVAAGAVRHRSARDRVRLLHVGGPLHRSRVNFAPSGAVAAMGTLGTPIAITSIAFDIGLLIIPFARETRGQTLPD
jgi:hypothetical protein